MKAIGETSQQSKYGRKTLGTIQTPTADVTEKQSKDSAVKSRLVLKQTKLSFGSSTNKQNSNKPIGGVKCQSCNAERLLVDAEIQTDCGSQSCAACSIVVHKEEPKNSIEELAEQFREALHHALVENEVLHQAYEDLKKEYQSLTVKAERASHFSLILQAIIEDAEDNDESKDSSSPHNKNIDSDNNNKSEDATA